MVVFVMCRLVGGAGDPVLVSVDNARDDVRSQLVQGALSVGDVEAEGARC